MDAPSPNIPAHQTASPSASHGSHAAQIILTGGEKAALDALTHLLQCEGFQVHPCLTIEEGSSQLKDHRADALVILTDALELPQITQWLEPLAHQPAWSDLPVLFVTSGDEAALQALLQATTHAAPGAILLEQPLKTPALVRSLRAALATRRRQHQVRDLLSPPHDPALPASPAQQQSHDQLTAFFDTASIGLHWVGPDGIILWANAAELQLLGYSKEEYFGHPIADFHADAHVIADILARLSKGDTSSDYQARLKHQDGSLRTVLINSSVHWEEGKFIHTQCFTTDITERKKLEQALREGEERYRALFESMDEGYCVIEVLFDDQQQPFDYRFLEVNPAFEKQSGLSGAKGKRILELVPGFEQSWFDAYKEVIETGKPIHFESASPAMARIFEVNAFRIGPSRRNHVGIVFNDITGRKAAESILRQSEERYRSLMESSPDCIKVLDGEGRLQQMNKNGLCLMEIDDFSPFVDKEWWQLWGEDNSSAVKQAIETAQQGGMAQFQAFCATAKGTPKWWDVVVAPVLAGETSGKPQTLISVSRDITASKNADEAFRQSEARFRAIVSQAATGVMHADQDGLMNLVNQRWCQMIGYSEAELLGRSLVDFIDPTQRTQTLAEWKALAEAGSALQSEKRYIRKDGSTFWANSSVNAILGSQGEFAGLAAVMIDTTERRTAEENLRLAKEEVEVASRAKDEFLATLSHELRTPLTPVLMTATALREDESLPLAVRAQLAMIERNVALEARLIDDLLDITRISKGKLSIHPETCDLNSLLGLVVDIVREEALEKQVHIEMALAAKHTSLIGDPTRLQQVFWNLLRNAVKFTPTGGSIRIRSSDASEAGSDPENGVRIEVSDSGIGLDAAAIKRIFHPFEQVALGHEKRQSGLGLGLAIAKGIVTLHDGTILAESAGHGQGSTFVVELPHAVAPAPPALSASGTPAPEAPGEAPQAEPPMRLLVVEDHDATRQVMTMLLTRAGHQVTGASSLAQARAAAAAQTFDAVISDLGLPDGTGIELMKELRDAYGLHGIVLSGYGMEEDLRRSREAGFVAHLVKPIQVKELRRALRQLASAQP